MAGYKGTLQNEYISFQVPVIKPTVLKSSTFGWMGIEENQFFQYLWLLFLDIFK